VHAEQGATWVGEKLAFAHRHSYEEVADWFRAAGYHDLEMPRDQVLPPNIPATVQQCVRIRGFFGQASASHLDFQEDLC
jgi:hypothetical protein